MKSRNLVFVAAAACFVSTCQSASVSEQAVDAKTRIGNTVRYFLTSWDQLVSGQGRVPIENSETGMVVPGLTATKNVAIVVHGRQSGVDSDLADTLTFSLATANQDMLIILVDWSYISTSPYDQLVSLVPFIADDLRDFILNMKTKNLELNMLHLIGFDLGAHIVGIASRNIATRARKITALSPAGERPGVSLNRLRGTDAQYVEVIHTDAVGNNAFGLTEPITSPALNIYVNGGTRQPGCAVSDNACHHQRAYQLFAATVDTKGHLIALRCNSMTEVNNNSCRSTPAVVVGTLALLKLQTGIYRVNTGGIYPY